MSAVLDWAGANMFLTLGSAAFVCGVALFYLVMRRTQKHRAATAATDR